MIDLGREGLICVSVGFFFVWNYARGRLGRHVHLVHPAVASVT